MDVDTFFSHIRGDLISLINRELTDLNSARVQMTTWIRLVQEFDDIVEADRAELAFNSRLMEVHQGSDLAGIVDGMITHIKTQIENLALANSRFRFHEVLFLDINFHRLRLKRGSSYINLPAWLAKKKVITNPHNDDEECFKWAIIAGLEIGTDVQRVLNLRNFESNYNWSGLEFPVSLDKIGVFKRKNRISVTVLGVEGKNVYILRKSMDIYNKRVQLLLLYNEENRHYTVIKSLSR